MHNLKENLMKKFLVTILIILAILSAVVSVVYFTKTAGSLPHFYLGYTKGSTHKHIKHGVVFAGLAVVLLLGAWMSSGQSKDAATTKKPKADE
jgi:hypothetical protein